MLICPTANHYFHLDHSCHYASLSVGTSISEKPGSYYSLLIFLIVHFQYTCIVVSESLTCNPMGNNFMSLSIMLRVFGTECSVCLFLLLVLFHSFPRLLRWQLPSLPSARLFHTFVIQLGSFVTLYISTRDHLTSYLFNFNILRVSFVL